MADDFLAKDLFIPLPRPEYVSLPEGFLSALAWKCLAVDDLPTTPDGQKLGLRYFVEAGAHSTKSVKFVQTMPTGDELIKLSVSLEQNGLEEVGNKNLLADALLNSIKGTSAQKSKFVPASPLTAALALLQNPVGLMGKQNPPDLANILEAIYSLGRSGKPTKSASALWLNANEIRLKNDALLRSIDKAFTEVVWAGKIKPRDVEPSQIESGLTAFLNNSPFEWFADTWEKITSEDWVLALPARVWVDWATCVLRTGFAMAYLWESSWYESLGRELLSANKPDEKFVERVILGMDPPIVWRGADSPAEIRDLSSKLKWRCHKAVEVKSVLEAWAKANAASEMTVSAFVTMVRDDPEELKKIQEALTPSKDSTSGSADNLWEAIRYSLITREKGDHYGFLESVGRRYLFASPGIEWGAMIASMSASRPGVPTNLGEVSSFLAKSGTQTQTKELLALLERTGLARGSADADLALQVETAYKLGEPSK